MKVGHFAVLGLLGWYFIVPPLQGQPPDWNARAPLSQWTTDDIFDTAEACKAYPIKMSLDARKKIESGEKDITDDLDTISRMGRGQCIASDDPRLAK
jgi:hypothetical protein